MEPSRRGALAYEISLLHSIRCHIHINQKHSDFLCCFVFNYYLNTTCAIYLIFINTLVCTNAAYSIRLEPKLCNCTLHRPIGNILFTTFPIVLFVCCFLFFWWIAWIKLQSKLVTSLRVSTLHWRHVDREGEMGL